ncbi:transporter substrate-binding domain-containing protein [Streptomyces luomodiensis]|uniref:Transporter substrate-binding domain-containing protein n=1 Tax=Streptomyces luomodiensis TaxID=3026192 RepID=A0ABY9UT57_9ACTN|nr:transporter substrate-binding domain-containing protein [Streptomyces sp. SCA4-21]WNE95167.1 transporter substrate-binding domain-containing protein [Streptomyces sp. SCA4-21]
MRNSHRRPRRNLYGTLATTLLLAPALTGCGASDQTSGASPSLAAAPALHNALPKSVKDSGVLAFAGDSHPPYRSVQADGSVTGIDRDLQVALGQVLGVRTEVKIVSNLPAALQGMLSGRYNAFNGPVEATAERERQFDTITWMTSRTSYVVPKDSDAHVSSAADLCGKRVAVVKASVVEGQLAKLSRYCTGHGKRAARSIGLDDTNATLLAARSGRADAAGMTQAAALDVTKAQPDTYGYVSQTEEQGATADHLALLVPKDSGLGPVLQKAFQRLFDRGEYRRIMKRWGLTDVMVDQPVLNIAGEES